ncbi:MAG: hypothetical protein ACYTGN_15740 [Planctomycetota bacterium]
MRAVSATLCLVLLPCCSLPPRVDDKSTPIGAYETFRGALARGEHVREWDCLSRGLRKRLGMRSRADWNDARAVALDQSHLLVKGISHSEAEGDPRTLDDGRVELKIDFPFGYEGTVVLRRTILLRAYAEGQAEPFLLEPLPELKVIALHDPAGVLVPLDPRTLEWIAEELDRKVVRFEVVKEWQLDDFAAGDETPATVRDNVEKKGRESP